MEAPWNFLAFFLAPGTRFLTLFVIGLFLIQPVAKAQICYDHLSAEHSLAYLKKLHPIPASAHRSERSQMVTVLVKVHIIRDNQGNAIGPEFPEIVAAIHEANTYFQDMNIRFDVCCGPTYVNNAALGFPSQAFDAYALEHDDQAYINLYSTHPISSSNAGYGYYPGFKSRIILHAASALIMAHELGHSFGLFHTFGPGFNGTNELVDGSNCTTAGDLICDTPADPYPAGSQSLETCAYTGTVTDANGDPYTPLMDNVMSYYYNKCITNFTDGQLDFMSDVHEHERFYYSGDNRSLHLVSFPDVLCNGTDGTYPLTASPGNVTFTGPGITNNVLNTQGLSPGVYTVTVTTDAAVTDSALVTDAAQIAYFAELDSAYVWQTYRAKRSGQVKQLHLRFKNAAANMLQLRIFSGSGTGGNILHSETISVAAASEYRWQELSLSSAFQQTAGQLYTIEVTALNGPVTWHNAATASASNAQETSSLANLSFAQSLAFIVACRTNQHHCGTSFSFDYEIKQPTAPYNYTYSLDPIFCIDQEPVDVKLNYLFLDSTAINGNAVHYLDPDSLGPGQHTVSFMYVDYYGCPHSDDSVITVFDYPDVGIPDFSCTSDAPFNLLAQHPNGTFWINGNQNNVFDPQALGTGTHTVEAHIPNPIGQTVYTAIPAVNSGGSGIDMTYPTTVGQSFKLDTTGYLKQIKFSAIVSEDNTYGYPIVAARIVSDTALNAPPIWEDTLVYNSQGWYESSFVSEAYPTALLHADSTYTVFLERVNLGSYNLRYVAPWGNTYANGEGYIYDQFQALQDFVFGVDVWHERHCGQDQVLTVEVNDTPPSLELGPDIEACDSALLTANTAPIYAWNTGASTQSIYAHASGSYWVEVSNGCIASDTVAVQLLPSATLEEIEGTTYLAPQFPYVFTVSSTAGSSYQWNAGTGTILSGQGTATITAQWPANTIDQLEVVETTVDGCSSPVVSLDIEASGAVGLGHVSTGNVRVYPNPASDQLFIELPTESDLAQCDLFSIDGQLIRHQTMQASQTSLALHGLSSGHYIVQLRWDNSTVVRVPVIKL